MHTQLKIHGGSKCSGSRINLIGGTDRLGGERLKSSCGKGSGSPGQQNVEYEPAVPWHQKGQLYPGEHQAQHCWPGKIVLLCSAQRQPHFEFWGQFGAPQYWKDIKLFREHPKEATKMLKDLKSCEVQLRSLGFSSLEKKRLREEPIAVYNFCVRGNKTVGSSTFSLVTSGRTQGNSMKF